MAILSCRSHHLAAVSAKTVQRNILQHYRMPTCQEAKKENQEFEESRLLQVSPSPPLKTDFLKTTALLVSITNKFPHQSQTDPVF